MSGDRVVRAIARMPIEFRRRDVSMFQLRQESGYPTDPGSVTADALEAEFTRHTEWIDAWVLESVDMRSVGHPWLRAPESAGEPWVVAPSADAAREEWETFDSAPKACAAYVLKYLEVIGS